MRKLTTCARLWLHFALRLTLPLFLISLSSSAQNSWIFSAPRDYPVGLQPESVVVGDFNGDGHPDIATANQTSNNVSILLQNSDGSFQPAVNYPVGNGPMSLQVGDVNNDGKLDLLVVNVSDNTLGILLGNGDGTFQPQKLTSISGGVLSLAVGDFNGDGKLDVAIGVLLPLIGNYAVAVLLGKGDGTFQSSVTYPVTEQPSAIAAADFNNDGKLDLVSVGFHPSVGYFVSVLPGKGDGTFQTAIDTQVSTATGLVIADFNLDGNLDIAMGNPNLGSNGVILLLGNGDGTFKVHPLSNTTGVPLAAGDLNGDGKPDLILSPIQILLNNGDGTFAAGESLIAAGNDPAGTAVLADMNGDQKLDLVLAQSSTAGEHIDIVTVVNGNGDGTLATPVIYGEIPPVTGGFATVGSLAAADFNGDGKIDLDLGLEYWSFRLFATGSAEGLYLNNGQGFSVPATTNLNSTIGTGTVYVAAGDFNGDGRMDLAASVSAVGIFLGNGDGTFRSELDYGSGMGGPLALGDFNNDGKLDVIGLAATQVAVLPGKGDGTFGFPVLSPTGSQVQIIGLAAADFNHDGNLDAATLVAAAGGSSPALQILMGKGDGSFSLGPSYYVGTNPTALATGDLNGDGIPDLVVGASTGQPTSDVFVLLGVGDGTFKTPISLVAGNGITALAVNDINLDGKADVVMLNSTWDDVGLLLGNGDGTFQPPMQFYLNNSISPNAGLAVADLNGDGKLDLAIAGAKGITMLLNVIGRSSPAAILSPATLGFASQLVGSRSAAQSAILSNSGPETLTIGSIAITGPQASDYQQSNTCGASLAPGLFCTISITFSPQKMGTRTAGLSVTGNASNLPQTTSLVGTGQGFSITAASSTQTISAGQTATYNLTVSPNGGFNQKVTMNCSGAPTFSTCSVSPSSFTLNGQATQSVTVTVTTMKASVSLALPSSGSRLRDNFDPNIWFLASLGLLSLIGTTRVQRRWRCRWLYGLASAGLLSVAMTMSSCGGGSGGGSSGGGGIQPGTYNLTVAGNFTSGSNTLTQSVPLTLIVQ
jgi:hypothetical protein